MKKTFFLLVGLLAAGASMSAQAAFNVFTCEPEWAALAQQLGGDAVSVYSATTAQQDPHQIQARPSLIARARQADLMVCSGAELEAGWLPQVLRQAANSKVQPGAPGYLEAALLVHRLEVAQRLDRAEGDVHASGNPHIQMDPRNIGLVADALAQRMAELDAGNAARYKTSHDAFSARWNESVKKWTEAGARLKGARVISHHKNTVYLYSWLGMEEAGTLEPKPGIPPTIAHLEELLSLARANPVRAIIRMPYEDERASQWLSERTQAPAVLLPGTVDGVPAAKDLFSLFDVTVNSLLAVIK